MKMPRLPLLFALALAVASCGAASPAKPERPHYLFYLHGKIIEDMGETGVSPRFGKYDYRGIVRALEADGLTVVSDVRPKGTDPSAYADMLVAKIRKKIATGVPPANITVVGASKGSVIAMLVSSRLRVSGIRYVFLANCNAWMERTFAPRFTGDVLSIYEASDEMAQSCRPIASRSPSIGQFKEIRLETGLGHGIVYRPLSEWVRPATAWAMR